METNLGYNMGDYSNQIDYKAADLKTEVHFLGQIIGASNLSDEDGIFCEAFFEAGDRWNCMTHNYTLQTQTSYTNVFITRL